MFQYLYTKTDTTLIPPNDNITTEILKKNIQNSVSYLNTETTDAVKMIYTSLYKGTRNHDIYFDMKINTSMAING